jgi:hypothetical protein
VSGSNGAPPQNLDAEQAVLGAVLLSDTALSILLEERLQPEEFYRDGHGRICQAMFDMRTAGEPVDALTLVDHLKQAGDLEGIEVNGVRGRAAIDLLTGSVPAVGNVRQYARIIRENAMLRRLLSASHQIRERADSNGVPARKQVELAKMEVQSIAASYEAAASLVTRASDVQSRSIRWAWTGRLALGYLAVQTGVEGLGKSVFAAWMIAKLTRGSLDGVFEDEPIDVLVVAGEDGIADTWRPRLELSCADLRRVHFLNLDGFPPDWNLRDGIEQLRAGVTQTGARFVFIDAALDHMPAPKAGESINSPTFVRGTFAPLKRLVRERDLSGLFSMHPPKGKGSDFRDLVQASQAFSAIPRVGLLFAYHPDDEDADDPDRRRVLLRGKGNLGRNPGALEFRVVGRSYRHDDGHTSEREVVVDVRPSDITMADLAADRMVGAREPTKQERAADFLREALADGEWHLVAPLLKALERQEISERTARYAATNKVVVEPRKRREQDGEWEWRLRPSGEAATPPADDEPAAALPLQPSRARDDSLPFAASPQTPSETSSRAKRQSGNDGERGALAEAKGQTAAEVARASARASDEDLAERGEQLAARHPDLNGGSPA